MCDESVVCRVKIQSNAKVSVRCRKDSCPRFKEESSPRLSLPPYVCNGCQDATSTRPHMNSTLHFWNFIQHLPSTANAFYEYAQRTPP